MTKNLNFFMNEYALLKNFVKKACVVLITFHTPHFILHLKKCMILITE